MKKFTLYTLLIVAILFVSGSAYILNVNNFKQEGSFQISKNTAPIKVLRTEDGTPYIIAENKEDAIRGQGFVTAQDRLFQMEFYRLLIKGQLASVVGASMLQSDIKMRVLNLPENAKKSFAYLDEKTKNFLTWYCEGFNEYLQVAKDEFPFELGLLGLEPTELTPLDIMSVIHFIGLNHGQNMEDEVLSLNLAAYADWNNELFPYNVNPDRTKALNFHMDSSLVGSSQISSAIIPKMPRLLLDPPEFGSNNWAISENKSASGKVIVCNDPHLDARLLPGVFHPVGIFCPEFKGVGLAIPGVPGLLIGRNEFVAFGVTNGYGDSQDLILEQAEGDHYLHEEKKLAFEKRKELIHIKDSSSVEIEVRSTIRGPIISDHEIFGIRTKDVVSLRWAQTSTQSKSIGVERLLETKNVFEFVEALKGVDNMFFNFVLGDVEGNIAHQTTGLIPKRINGQGAKPQASKQLIADFIPKGEMPHTINPERGWVGTANHDTRPDDYPHYYSSHFSPAYRYMRMQEVLGTSKKLSSEDLWQLVTDCKNKQAEQLTPLFIATLEKEDATKELANILKAWNYMDAVEERGAAVYNVLYTVLNSLVLADEIPDELEEDFWKNGYYWMQRMDDLILSNHEFIDDKSTPEEESLDDLIIKAGIQTHDYLSKAIG
ncbi:MAG: penicillin acylase family protein, partial [Bacteroidota bacterium]